MKRTIIPVGPFHPIQEEPEFFQITVEGERVVDMDVRLSYNHRGMEKLCEDLTYDQIPILLARICGICSASHPMAFCQALEDLCGVEVPIRARYIRSIICEIIDDGIGIPQAERPNLMQDFFRASNARASGQEGTGLGLSIVREIVDKSGGRLSIESLEDLGTCAVVTLPCIPQEKG